MNCLYNHKLNTMTKKTKLEILASLLQRDKISIEEFITLMEKEVQYVYQPYYHTSNYPYNTFTIKGNTSTGIYSTTAGTGNVLTTGITSTTEYSYPSKCNCEADYNFCTCNSSS